MAPPAGLEPATTRLTAGCSAIELRRNTELQSVSFAIRVGNRRRPTLPGRFQPSTIGAEGLNFCVRDGNRWGPFAFATGSFQVSLEDFRDLSCSPLSSSHLHNRTTSKREPAMSATRAALPIGLLILKSSPRPISNGKLNTLLHLHRRPITR